MSSQRKNGQALRAQQHVCNPSIAEAREVVNKYINEPEEVKNSGEGPPTCGHNRDKLTAEELANSESITARNPSPAETREMATKYTKEPEDKNISGGGVRAMRRHGGTIVMAYGVKMRDFKKWGFCWPQREYLYRI
jgi:hypothetical protein